MTATPHKDIMSEKIPGKGAAATRSKIRAARMAIATAVLALAVIAAWWRGAAIMSLAAQWDARTPLSRVKRSDGKLALTFDSGWGEDYTQAVLDALSARGLRATFFLTGYWIDENPETVRAIIDAGHEVGGHSVTHSRMTGMEHNAMISEIRGVNERLSAFTDKPTLLFRPPYGDWDLNLLMCVRDCGQIAILWSVDTQSALNAQDMRAALDLADSGDIVLMSLTDANVPEQLSAALDDMLARGLEICTVSELIGISGSIGAKIA